MSGRLAGRLAFVTGASSGIGEATARALAAEGARLLLAARRIDRLELIAGELRSAHGSDIRTMRLDVTDRAAVAAAIESLPAGWESIDILVNNAGKAIGFDRLPEGNIDDWDEMIDTNLKGLLYVDRAVLPGMVARGRGHVIHIGSIAGHDVYPAGNVYCATKSAVDALTRGLRIDVVGKGIKVSTVDPGLVETEFSRVRFKGDEERAGLPYRGITPLVAADVADAVVYIVTRPPHVNIAGVTLLAADQASVRDYHRV